MQQVGLLKSKTKDDVIPTKSLKDESAPFFQLQRYLKLVPKKPETFNLKEPTDASYVFGGAYIPLSVAAISSVVSNGGWGTIENSIKSWEGASFTEYQFRSLRKERLEKRVILVYFIGGVTYSEVSALRFIEQKLGCHFIIATTDVVNWKRLLDSFMEFEVS